MREAIGRDLSASIRQHHLRRRYDEILNRLAQTYLGRGDEAISPHGFLVYPIRDNGERPAHNVSPPRTRT